MPALAVTTQHNDNWRTGANLAETALNTSNVRPGGFGKLFSRSVDGYLYTQPLYVSQVDIPRVGSRNVVYVATMHNSVYAFDADDPHATNPLWKVSLGPPCPLPDPNIGPGNNYHDIAVEVGVVSTPVIAPDTNTLYVVAFTKDPDNTYHHRLHALDLTTGAEKFGGPVPFAATVPGTGQGSVNGQITFASHLHIQRSALTLANGRVYAAFASYGDSGPYHGWVFGFDATTLRQTGVFNTTPDLGLGGIWQAGQGLAVDDAGCLYFMTGNGPYPGSPWHDPNGTDLHGSVIKLTPDLKVADWFAPYNVHDLDNYDQDLGSAGPLLIPGTDLLLGGGKQSKFYLLDTTKMGNFNPGSDSQIPQSFFVDNDNDGKTHHIHGGAIYWNFPGGPWAYVWCENAFLRAYKFADNRFQTTPVSISTTTDPTGVPGGSTGMPGGMLSISAHGEDPDSGILWASHPYNADANQAVVAGILRAYQASDLTKELWNSKMDAARDDVGNFAKFAAPTIAAGKVYLGTFSGQLNVYGLLG